MNNGLVLFIRFMALKKCLNLCSRKPSCIHLKDFVTPKEGLYCRKVKGKIHQHRSTKTGGRSYDKFFICVPTEVARDGTFPFKEGEEVVISIENKKVVITKTEKNDVISAYTFTVSL